MQLMSALRIDPREPAFLEDHKRHLVALVRALVDARARGS
jgi:hypothetical protein